MQWLFAALFVFCASAHASNVLQDTKKTVYIYSEMSVSDIFAINDPNFNRDNSLEPLYQLREKAAQEGFDIKQVHTLEALSDFEYLIVFNVPADKMGYLHKYPKEKLLLFLWEPPSVMPENYRTDYHEQFSKVYTWNDSLVDNQKYWKLFHPVLIPMIQESISFEKKKLCTLIACNKWSAHPNELYSERSRVIQFYESQHSDEFDLYGKWWPNNCKVYKGQIARKVDFLKLYKFAYAYENIKGVPGYVTEKIFDCFHAGCVPVYYGASNIALSIPKECFIDRTDFKSDEELYNYLKSMNEVDYQRYIQNIQKFLTSEEAQSYSIETFVKTVIDQILLSQNF